MQGPAVDAAVLLSAPAPAPAPVPSPVPSPPTAKANSNAAAGAAVGGGGGGGGGAVGSRGPAPSRAEMIVTSVLAGGLAGLLVSMRTVSYATLMFPAGGSLGPYFSSGVAQLLWGNVLTQAAYLLIGLQSMRWILFGQSSTLAPYIGSMIAALLANAQDYDVPATDSDDGSGPASATLRNTVFALMWLSGLFVGLAHLLLGRLRLGKLLAFFPLPVRCTPHRTTRLARLLCCARQYVRC
jgi:hypothetical protein